MTERMGARRAVGQAEGHGERVAHSDVFEWGARAGLVARGVVYGIIGILAIKLALGDGGKATDQQGALRTIATHSFGKVLLVFLAIGLAGYALWRLVRAILGHGPEDSDDVKDRLSGLESGIGYALLCATAVKILIGAGSHSSSTDQKTAGVLGWPAGRYIVGIAGLVVIGAAVEQAYKGLKRKFLEDSKTGEMGPRMRKVFTAMGVFGHLARAVVFALIGYFLIRAAIDYDADRAVGLDGALATLGQSSYGPLVLAVCAAGLIGFGIYSALDARYRRV
jgi:uncharacterized protein DUF1206